VINRLYITVAALLGKSNGGGGVKLGACRRLRVGSAAYVGCAYKFLFIYLFIYLFVINVPSYALDGLFLLIYLFIFMGGYEVA
jgi:hypothetical protein